MISPSTQPRRVVVTAMGVISPLGIGLSDTLASLRAGRDCVTPVTAFDVSRCRSKTAGQIRKVPGSCAVPSKRPLHPAGYMMISAAREALSQDAGFQPELMVIGTTSGGMSFGEEFYRALVGKVLRTE